MSCTLESSRYFLPRVGKIHNQSDTRQVAQNIDGLATVLSHEAAHVLARHGAERMSSGFILMPLVLLVSSVFSLPVSWVQAAGQLLLMLPNSRLQESEAGNFETEKR